MLNKLNEIWLNLRILFFLRVFYFLFFKEKKDKNRRVFFDCLWLKDYKIRKWSNGMITGLIMMMMMIRKIRVTIIRTMDKKTNEKYLWVRFNEIKR